MLLMIMAFPVFFSLLENFMSGVIISLFAGIIIVTIIRLKQESKVSYFPNQGIWQSLQYQVLIVTIVFPLLMSLMIKLSLRQYWGLGLQVLLFICFIVGGRACLQHLSLRIVLWQSGLPWNFARFLNYCVERRLLLRVGGSYRFLHRELLDHFTPLSR